jgi:hypothetical protein
MIPKWSSNYIGIPFSDKNCWELIRLIYLNERSINLPSYSEEYDDYKDGINISEAIRNHSVTEDCWTKIKPGEERLFDIAWMRAHYRLGRNDEGKLQFEAADMHVGMVLERYTLIHTEDDKIGSCAGFYDRQPLSNRIISFHRYVGGE